MHNTFHFSVSNYSRNIILVPHSCPSLYNICAGWGREGEWILQAVKFTLWAHFVSSCAKYFCSAAVSFFFQPISEWISCTVACTNYFGNNYSNPEVLDVENDSDVDNMYWLIDVHMVVVCLIDK